MNPRLVKLTLAWFALLGFGLCAVVNGKDSMLVLTRFPDESIVVSQKHNLQPLLRIQVMDVRGDRVRLGIEGALDEFFIDRNKVYSQRVREADGEKKASAAQ